MEEKIKLIQEKNKFELKIKGTTIPNVKSYEILSSAEGISTLKIEIVIPTIDVKVQIDS